MKESVTLTAHWRRVAVDIGEHDKTFVATFDSRGGSYVPSLILKEGQALTVPTDPTKNGQTFDK